MNWVSSEAVREGRLEKMNDRDKLDELKKGMYYDTF
jgi:hypothetical protein